MLTELCKELNNWFEKERIFGVFKIEDGQLTGVPMQDGQFFRIIGSVFNDGVHEYPCSNLEDEEFDGAVWTMAVPPSVVALAKEIKNWNAEYGGIGSAAMSPFQSESFGGYSYTMKSGGSSNGDGSSAVTWKSVFANHLNRWRKIRP